MAQFIQSSQLSPIQGAAGQQSVVENRGPTVAESIGKVADAGVRAYDAAGTVYAKNKAQSMVNEELENAEAAQAMIEKAEADENFVTPEDKPVSDSEFTMIQGAVRSGGMTREKARLIASSRLRTRIAEAPMFADKLRAAASEVVGFNIQSEPVRQYFAAFQTEAQKNSSASSPQTQQEKWMDRARAIHIGMPDVPVDEIYRNVAKQSYVETQKDLALDQKAKGLASEQDTFAKINQENSNGDFVDILGSLKTAFNRDGSVDAAAAKIHFAEAEAVRMNEIDNIFSDHTSAAYKSAQAAVSSRFKQMEEFVNNAGFDNLQQIGIDRVIRANEVLGNKMFRYEKFVIQNLGAETFNQSLDMIANVQDPSRLQAMFENSPLHGRVGALAGNPTALRMFGQQISGVFKNISQGKPLSTEKNEETGTSQEELLDTVSSKLVQAGGESEESIIEYLQAQGYESKPVSLLSQKNPNRASPSSKKYFKKMYNDVRPKKMQELGQILATRPDIAWEMGEDGRISIEYTQDKPGGLQGAFRAIGSALLGNSVEAGRIDNLVEHVNLYADALDRQWGSVVEANHTELRNQMRRYLDEGFTQAVQARHSETANLVMDKNSEDAQESFKKLQSMSDAYKDFTFQQYQDAVFLNMKNRR